MDSLPSFFYVLFVLNLPAERKTCHSLVVRLNRSNKEPYVESQKVFKVKYTLNDKTKAMKKFSRFRLFAGNVPQRADQLASLCLRYGIGATYDEAEQRSLGVRVKSMISPLMSCVCPVLVDVIYQLIESAPAGGNVPLDELMYD